MGRAHPGRGAATGDGRRRIRRRPARTGAGAGRGHGLAATQGRPSCRGRAGGRGSRAAGRPVRRDQRRGGVRRRGRARLPGRVLRHRRHLHDAASRAPPGLAVADGPDTLTGNCGGNPGIACRLAWDLSHSTTATQLVKVYLAGPVSQAGRILFVVLLALFVRAIINRLINKVTERAATTTLAVTPNGRAPKAAGPLAGTERRAQRARAPGSILRSPAAG